MIDRSRLFVEPHLNYRDDDPAPSPVSPLQGLEQSLRGIIKVLFPQFLADLPPLQYLCFDLIYRNTSRRRPSSH